MKLPELLAPAGDLDRMRTAFDYGADAIYADTAREFGLAASRGSDFHSPDESHTELGTLPFLPANLTPVWEALASRIQ